MLGLMQNWPLTVDKILDHAKNWHPDREIVSRTVEGPIARTTWGEVHGRAKRISNALKGMGVRPGDRVATLAWNTARHIEAWYGIMGIGAVCHTLNPRLFAEQLCYIINTPGLVGTAAHIHVGKAGEDGAPVVPLAAPAKGASGGCVDLKPDLEQKLLSDPDGYYVMVSALSAT